jgi:hypothetical protein
MKPDTANNRIKPAEYAALGNFLRGYLHQDATREYGSPRGAALAFRRDGDEREAAVVRAEIERLLEATSDLPFSELAQILERDLGSKWRFQTREEIAQLRDALK